MILIAIFILFDCIVINKIIVSNGPYTPINIVIMFTTINVTFYVLNKNEIKYENGIFPNGYKIIANHP